jgi:hypothetical protein
MLFTPTRLERALFVPPVRSRMMLAAAPAWEKVGLRLFQTFAGVLIIESGKKIYTATPEPLGVRRRRYTDPALQP